MIKIVGDITQVINANANALSAIPLLFMIVPNFCQLKLIMDAICPNENCSSEVECIFPSVQEIKYED